MELAYISGAVFLGGAIAYGMFRYYSRNKANDKVAEQAVREMQRNPEAYMHGGREKNSG